MLTAAQSGSSTLASILAGSGALVKSGAGTLALAGVNTFTGGASVLGGTLSVGADSALGGGGGALTLNGGTFATSAGITSSRALVLAASGGTVDSGAFSSTWNGTVSGAGSLTKTGAGTFTLAGANTGTGSTVIEAGTLATSGSGRLSTGALTLNGGTASLNAASQTISGLTSVSGSTLALGTGHTLTIHQASDSTAAGLISGAGGLQFNGPGRLTVSAANTYSGNTVLSGGAMVLANPSGSALGSSALTVHTAGILAGTGSMSGSANFHSGGSVSPGSSPGPATLTLGSTTLGAAGSYTFEIKDAAGTAGTAWDLLSVNGALNITATEVSPFRIHVSSLSLANTPGQASNFATGDSRFWTLISAGT